MEKIVKEKVIAFKVDEKMGNKIDLYAKKIGLNRSQLVRNIVESGIEDLEIMNKTGMLTLALRGYDVIAIVRRAIRARKYEIKDNNIIIDLEQ